MTYCRDIPPDLTRNWQSLADMYTGLGVYKQGDTAMAPPKSFGSSSSFSYMTETQPGQKRAFNISRFNDAAARQCLFTWAGYNETAINQEIDRIRQEKPAAEEEAAVEAYLQTLSPLHQNIYRAFGMMREFQKAHAEGGVNRRDRANPNDRGDPNVVTDYEIQEYARDVVGNDTDPRYLQVSERLIAGLNATLGIMHYLTTEPPTPPSPPQTAVRPSATFAQGEEVLFAAPAGGWEGGELIFVNGNDITDYVVDQMPYGEETPVLIPNDYLSEGVNEIVLQRVDGSFETQQVTIRPTAATIPAPEETGSRSFMDSVGDFFSEPTVAFGAGALAAGLVAFIFLRRAVKGRSEAETRLAEETQLRTKAEGKVTQARAELTRVQGEFGSIRSTLDTARPEIEADLPRLRSELQVKEGELGTAEGSLGRTVADANLQTEIGRVEADVSAKAGEVSRLQAQLTSRRPLPKGVTKAGIRQELTRLTGEEKGNGTAGELGQARAELETLRDIARLRVEVAQWKVDIALRDASLQAPSAFEAFDAALNPQPLQSGGTAANP